MYINLKLCIKKTLNDYQHISVLPVAITKSIPQYVLFTPLLASFYFSNVFHCVEAFVLTAEKEKSYV